MQQAAAVVKAKVYDNRIVTFAPLYLSNLCVNDCLYCGFRGRNARETRRILSRDEVRREVLPLGCTQTDASIRIGIGSYADPFDGTQRGDRQRFLHDVMMTTKNEGFSVARELHDDERLKETPIIIMTGIRREMNLPFGFEPDETWLPVKRVLEKPVKPEVLLSAISENIHKA